jgi:hypothetical protein
LLLAVAILGFPSTDEAATIDGSVRVFAGTTDSNTIESDNVDQRAILTLNQPFGPWLNLSIFYRYNLNRNTTEAAEFERTSKEPEAVLAYNRPNFTTRLSYADRRLSGTNSSDNFNATTAIALVNWRPRRGPQYQLQYRAETNVADPQLFGRDTESDLFQFDATWDRPKWSARASFIDSAIDNNLTGFQLNQTRLLFRANAEDRYFDDRLTVGGEGWLSRVDQTEEAPSGSFLAQPVPTVQGLFAVDTTPVIGSLDPTPGLIDGDLVTPVIPRIEIGGANLFRNIGVDLGVTNRVTRLEITTDTLSDPTVLWEVWHSPDNFNWERIDGVTTVYEEAFLRYTLIIPETVDRFFKAVNVSPNALANIAVTEIRPLLDVESLGRDEAKSTTYRVEGRVRMLFTRRFRGSAFVWISNETDIAAGRVSQEIDEFSLNLPFEFEISRKLMWTFAFRTASFEQDLEPVLSRTEKTYSTGLQWTPMPNIRGSFDLQRRDETDSGSRIRSTETARLRAQLRIFPELLVNSELVLTDVEDFANRFVQQVLRWIETIETRPARTWRVGGGWSVSWFDSKGIVTLDKRVTTNLFTSWQMFPYLTWNANLAYNTDDFQTSITQRYSMLWAPGRKLSVSLYYQDDVADLADVAREIRRVVSYGGSLSYRLNRWFTLFANANRASTDEFGFDSTSTSTGRLGFNLNF